MGTANAKKPLPSRLRSNMGGLNLNQKSERPPPFLPDGFSTTNIEAELNNMNYDNNYYHQNNKYLEPQTRSQHPQYNDSVRRNDIPLTFEIGNERKQNYSQRNLEPNIFTNIRPIVPDVNFVPSIQPSNPVLMPHNLNGPILTRKISNLNDEKKSRYLKAVNKAAINPTVVNPSQNTLKKLYDIQPYEMRKLQKLFYQFAGADRKMNFQEFVKLYGNINPSLRGPDIVNIAEQAFLASDTNDDGLLNFDEFLIAYCLTKPDRSFAGFPDLYKPSLNHFNEYSQTFQAPPTRSNMLPYYPPTAEIQQPVFNEQKASENIQATVPVPAPIQQVVSIQQPTRPPVPTTQPPYENYNQQLHDNYMHQAQQPQHSFNNQPLPTEEQQEISYDYNDRRRSPPNPKPQPEMNHYPPTDFYSQKPPEHYPQPNPDYYQHSMPDYQNQTSPDYYPQTSPDYQQQQQPLSNYQSDYYSQKPSDYYPKPTTEYNPQSVPVPDYQHQTAEMNPQPMFDLNLLPPPPLLPPRQKRTRQRTINKYNSFSKPPSHSHYNYHHHHRRSIDEHPPLFDLDNPLSFQPAPPPRQSTRRRTRC